MKSIRWIPVGLIASGVLLLSGCVAVPGSYGYDSGYYSQPAYPTYYNEPAPVVVSPSVYLQGGTYYDRGDYNRGYYEGRPRRYDGPPQYDGRGPDRGPRPGPRVGPRPDRDRAGPAAGQRPPPPPRVAGPKVLPPEFRQPIPVDPP